MPDVPLAHRSTGLGGDVAAVFAADGALSHALGGYEPRPGQAEMAAAVASVLESGGTLLAEAGTGTGKTLAYLIPAILSRQRVLVSTGTKNLQEQIFFKDLPALRQVIDVPFTATLMKGRSNYLCLHRFQAYRECIDRDGDDGGRLIESGDRVLLPLLDEWVQRTGTGDRAELSDLPEDLRLWKHVAADGDTCLGTKCTRYDDCFVTRVRQRAAESDVVIVNHHLLCADAAVRQSAYGEVIPASSTLIVDEAHQLEEVATQYFGVAVSNHRVDDLVRDAEQMLASRPFESAPGDTRDPHEYVLHAVARVAECSRSFFTALVAGVRTVGPFGQANRDAMMPVEQRVRYSSESLTDHFESAFALTGALDALDSAILQAGRPRQPDGVVDENEDATAIARRAGEVRDQLRFLVRAGDSDYVYFLETRGRSVSLRASPIDVSSVVRDVLFDRQRAAVLTSATLTVEGSFDYIRGRLGIRHAAELRVPSGFDYKTQAILYLPRRMPRPKSPTFGAAVAREVGALLTRTSGRAFVLFTSYAMLREVQQFVEMTLPYPVLVQGTAPRSALIDRFRTTPHAVLLATSSFWQGVDVPGDALSCVIIDKLPFASPSEPVTAARIEAIAARGGDPFAEYQVPLAILALQQGLGRLIRHRADRGVLAILDPRLRTMGYGRRFLASLPPAPVTLDLGEIERFFSAPGTPHG